MDLHRCRSRRPPPRRTFTSIYQECVQDKPLDDVDREIQSHQLHYVEDDVSDQQEIGQDLHSRMLSGDWRPDGSRPPSAMNEDVDHSDSDKESRKSNNNHHNMGATSPRTEMKSTAEHHQEDKEQRNTNNNLLDESSPMKNTSMSSRDHRRLQLRARASHLVFLSEANRQLAKELNLK